MPENTYYSLAKRFLTPNSSYTALTRVKIVTSASLLQQQQQKALGFNKKHTQMHSCYFTKRSPTEEKYVIFQALCNFSLEQHTCLLVPFKNTTP